MDSHESTPDLQEAPARKHCRVCHEEKDLETFPRDRTKRDGRSTCCRHCQKLYKQQYRLTHQEHIRALGKAKYHKHRVKYLAANAQWRQQNRQRLLSYYREYNATNREHRYLQRKQFALQHPDHVRHQRQQSNAKRREKILAYLRAYNAARRNKVRDYDRVYREVNRETISEKARVYRQANRDAIRLMNLRYRRKNPEKVTTYAQRRRARKAAAVLNDLTTAQWHEILVAYDYRCVYCHRKMQRLTQDHLTPLSQGGNHTASNIVPACRSCNSKKNNRAPLSPVQPLLLTATPPKKKRPS